MRVVLCVVSRFLVFAALGLTAGAAGPPDKNYPVCDPFFPHNGCFVDIDFTNGTQQDVAVSPGGAATVHVFNRPPFSTCSLAASPSALTRDASAAFGGFLTQLGSIGLLGGGPAVQKG